MNDRFLKKIRKETGQCFPIKKIIRIILRGYLPDKIPHDLHRYFLLFLHEPFNTCILKAKDKVKFLDEMCAKLRSNVQLIKIYDTKKDGFKAKTFHNKCDNKGPTLCIIKNNHKYIFGGYTSKSWKSPKEHGNTWCNDRYAFIYGIKPKFFISTVNFHRTSRATAHNKDYCMIFGYYEICICNDSNDESKINSSASYENIYQFTHDCPLTAPKQKPKKNEFFQVTQLEVFQVLK